MLDLESVNEWWYEEEPDLPTGTFIRKIRSNIELKTNLYSILGTSKAQKIWFSKLLESTRSIIEYMEENHSDKIESY